MNAIWVESLKARRSRLPWVTVFTFTVVALVGGLFMFILQDPDRARAMGLLGTKAALVGGEASWPTYFALLVQATAVGGMILFGLVLTWIFGREFGQDTVKDLLALPTPRVTIVCAKFTVAAVWCMVLALYLYAVGLIVGGMLDLPGWSAPVAVDGAGRILASAVMTFVLATSLGRGFLAGVGTMIAMMFLAQIVAALGYGHYFPWSVPAVFSGIAGPDQTPPGPLGFTLVAVVGMSCVLATVAWWRYADQDRSR